MICPSCSIGVRLAISGTTDVYTTEHPTEKQWGYDIAHGFCPECNQLIVLLRRGTYWQHGLGDEATRELDSKKEEVIYPRRRVKSVSPDVPPHFHDDFSEAYACLDVSPKASAAVSRRLLQDVLENHFSIQKRSLEKEIEEFISRTDVPPFLSQQVDAVRKIGNFVRIP